MKNIRKINVYPKTLDNRAVFCNIRKVAVYARVSTSSEEQLNSIEAQKEYYIKMIAGKPEWDFCGLYADEGISGISHKNRDGFNKMMDDASEGKFNLIITKSISRFARNTVDSLVCIRKLKDIDVEVYFQKEDLWTFDSKGEFMLTLLSSMAQEESRSISENVTWGYRKRFADGKYHVPYKQFLGYDRGVNGELIVNDNQSMIIRLIYRLFLEGQTAVGIACHLDNLGVITPGGNVKWSQTTVNSILTNEKYKGDALLQKKFTVDFMTKKRKRNDGELPQYYVIDGHEAIIPRATFDLVQEMVANRRKKYGRSYSCVHPLSAKIQCGDCGSYFGLKGSHSGKYRQFDWYCNDRTNNGFTCHSPRIREEYMEQICRIAFQCLLQNHLTLIKKLIQIMFSSSKPILNICHNQNRMIDIASYIDKLINISVSQIEIPNEVLSIIIKKIHATIDSNLIFEFINGEKVDIAFDRKLMKHKEETQVRYLGFK